MHQKNFPKCFRSSCSSYFISFCFSLEGALGAFRGFNLRHTFLSGDPALCALQRLKDEIAEVANEIENLGSTEER